MAEPVLKVEHPGNPLAQLWAWLKDMAAHVASAAVCWRMRLSNCPIKTIRPARDRGLQNRAAGPQPCAAVALAEPEMLADEPFLLHEDARVTAPSMGSRENL